MKVSSTGDSEERTFWPSLARDVLIAFSALAVLAFLYIDIESGGNDYKQADWLINDVYQTVRRGLFGSFVLKLSDAVQVSPLLVIALIQASLVVSLYFMLRHLLVRIPGYHSLLLVLSPAFFVVFWPANAQGSLRKELIGFVAIAFAIIALRSNKTLWLALSGALLVIGMFANELNALFIPTFLVLVYFHDASDAGAAIRRLPILPAGKHLICLSTVIFAGVSVWYAFKHWEVADPGLICKPLLERGLSPELCDGAIMWLGKGYEDRANEFFAEYFKPGYIVGHCALYVLSLLPLFYLLAKTRNPMSLAVLCAISIAPVLALYPMVVDWGRLMDIQAFIITCILLSRTLGGDFWTDNQVDGSMLAIFALSIFVWTPAHTNGLVEGGLGSAVNDLAALF